MIHIATVHHKSDKWIDIQLMYIEKYLKSPYRIYAFLNGIKKDYSRKFYFSSKEKINEHAEKLNSLAQKICETADDSDLIMFIDGDAFPINKLDAFLEEKLKLFPLIAIKRNIDFGDCQPHPSFCATTVGFWKSINGDWSKGYSWVNEITKQQFTDVGANLLKILVEKNINWYSLERSNLKNIHNRRYGVYNNLIYHHGAGFRIAISKIELDEIQKEFTFFEKILANTIFIRRFFYRKRINNYTKQGTIIKNMISLNFDFYKEL